MKTIRIIVGVGFILCILLLIGYLVLFLQSENLKVSEGDCYDRYSNKINNTTCEVKEYGKYYPGYPISIFIALMFIFELIFLFSGGGD